ncbi:Rhomboid protein 19 [Spatholobus suberectus]|nr:Rhomboid protein 19 [Spatholobus suberectus]
MEEEGQQSRSDMELQVWMKKRTIPFAWNLITAGYVEQSVYGAVVSTFSLLFIGKLLEPIWGSREFIKFIFVVNLLTSVCVFITAIALYYITRLENYLYMPLSGFHGVISGFLVGIKQIIPDQELPFIKIKTKTGHRPYCINISPNACGRSDASNDGQGYTLESEPLPGSDSIEASRRRERGARALEERLAAERLAVARRDCKEKLEENV